MKKLLTFVVKSILGDKSFEIAESKDQDRLIYTISTDKENLGLLIGKGGNTIKAIRALAKIRAIVDSTLVRVEIAEN